MGIFATLYPGLRMAVWLDQASTNGPDGLNLHPASREQIASILFDYRGRHMYFYGRAFLKIH